MFSNGTQTIFLLLIEFRFQIRAFFVLQIEASYYTLHPIQNLYLMVLNCWRQAAEGKQLKTRTTEFCFSYCKWSSIAVWSNRFWIDSHSNFKCQMCRHLSKISKVTNLKGSAKAFWNEAKTLPVTIADFRNQFDCNEWAGSICLMHLLRVELNFPHGMTFAPSFQFHLLSSSWKRLSCANNSHRINFQIEWTCARVATPCYIDGKCVVHGGANKNEVGTSSSFKWCGKRFVHWNGWKTHTKMVRMNDFIKPWSNSYWNTTFALPFFMFRARNCQTTTNYCQLCPPSDRNIDLPSSNWCGQKFKSFYFRNESNVFFLTRLMLFLSSISTTFAFWC